MVNAGSISGANTASGHAQSGIWLSNGGSVTNQSGGVINGFYGVYGAGGDVTVLNAGEIDAGAGNFAIRLAGGSTNRVIVDPGAVFVGTVSGGNSIGANALSYLELAAGRGAGATGTLSGLGSYYVDFAQIEVDSGASWAVTGVNTIVAGAAMYDSGCDGVAA